MSNLSLYCSITREQKFPRDPLLRKGDSIIRPEFVNKGGNTFSLVTHLYMLHVILQIVNRNTGVWGVLVGVWRGWGVGWGRRERVCIDGV